ncbi:MAG: ornithine cyclodeaminase family protein [Proteobacteria bacterium]|nr:ornithine cyclodeaminase family protein [Pseudomonadota bacterium]
MPIRILNRSQVDALLTPQDCIRVVEEAFIAHARQQSLQPQAIHGQAPEGDFHIKVGGIQLGRLWYVVKAGSVFVQNPVLRNLPTIQGALILFDADSGSPVAIMDAIAMTGTRTAAATTLAIRHLASLNAATACLVGCGVQGLAHLRCLAVEKPGLGKILIHDHNPDAAQQFLARLPNDYPIPVQAATSLQDAVSQSQIVITCTPSREPYLSSAWVKPGTLVAAVGADSPAKRELDPQLLAISAIVPDLAQQCARVGELHHAIDAKLVSLDNVRAELGEILAAHKPGRLNDDEIIVYDGTGTALQDVAAAVTVYEAAERQNIGLVVEL